PARGRISRLYPASLTSAADGGLDEVHAARALLHGGEVGVELTRLLSRDTGGDGAGGVAVDVREGFDEGFVMPEGDARVVANDGVEVVVAALVDSFGLVDVHHAEVVGILLPPVEARFGAVDPHAQPVLLTDGNLRGVDDAAGAPLVMNQEVGVVLQLVSGAEGGGVGADRLQLQTGDVARQVPRVQPDVTDG